MHETGRLMPRSREYIYLYSPLLYGKQMQSFWNIDHAILDMG